MIRTAKIAIVLFVVLIGFAQARTITVGPDPDYDFNSIQPAIDDANNGDTIIVQPGVYTEYIIFDGKNITLTSTNPGDFNVVASTIINGRVWFLGTEDPNCTLTGFKINRLIGGNGNGQNHTHATISYCLLTGNLIDQGTVISGCDGTISNCVIVNNLSSGQVFPGAIYGCHGLIKNCTIANNFIRGIRVLNGGTTTIENCIIYGNGISVDGGATLNILYSNVEGGIYSGGDRTVNWGPGNIDADPCFADPAIGDYHLKSQAGRWDPNSQNWVQDDVTSPCIDTGNPNSPIGAEPFPNGGLINMGAYGGTPEASKSYFGRPPCEIIIAGDVNGDCEVNWFDFQIIALHWLRDENQ
ncbi:MAG: hypothetical protein FVQ85_07240 [Planctomycetes bacterium]|nr:hypothetical protein [Planctomycetota bacterium]